jgi:hypothetical protein
MRAPIQGGVTTTAPSLPMQLGTVPVLSPTMASAADGRQSSLTGLLLAIDMPICDRSETPEIMGKQDSHNDSVGAQCRLFNQIAHIVGDATSNSWRAALLESALAADGVGQKRVLRGGLSGSRQCVACVQFGKIGRSKGSRPARCQELVPIFATADEQVNQLPQR